MKQFKQRQHNSLIVLDEKKLRKYLIRFGVLIAALYGVGLLITTDAVRFYRITNLWKPSGAKVVSTGDDHGGLLGDGEFYYVFQIDDNVIEGWLKEPPPWGAEWKRGPIPGEIGFHCMFGTTGVSWTRLDNGAPFYHGERKLVDLLSSDQIWYAARERSTPWHNGDLLLLDRTKGQVWLSSWDF